jgi:hypothetical protein
MRLCLMTRRNDDTLTFAAAMHHQHAPLGPLPTSTTAYRFTYPTLMCVSDEHTFLHGVHAGVLVHMINLNDQLRLVRQREQATRFRVRTTYLPVYAYAQARLTTTQARYWRYYHTHGSSTTSPPSLVPLKGRQQLAPSPSPFGCFSTPCRPIDNIEPMSQRLSLRCARWSVSFLSLFLTLYR